MSTLTINDGYMPRCSTQAYCSSIPGEVRVPAGKQWQKALPAWEWILSATADQLLEAERVTTLTSLSFPSFPGGFMTGKVTVLFNSPSSPISSYKDARLLTTHTAHLSIRFQIHQCTQKEAHCWSLAFRSEYVVRHTQNSATKGQVPNRWTYSRQQNKTMSSVNYGSKQHRTHTAQILLTCNVLTTLRHYSRYLSKMTSWLISFYGF